jgi:hypothetical protein
MTSDLSPDRMIACNQRNWDARTPVHLASEFYDVAAVRVGANPSATLLRPGGRLCLVEFHPLVAALDVGEDGVRVRDDYPAGTEGREWHNEWTYTDGAALAADAITATSGTTTSARWSRRWRGPGCGWSRWSSTTR